MLRKIAIALAASAAVMAQDQPAPDEFQGVWEGTRRVGYAAVDPNVPDSYECLSGIVPEVQESVTIGEYDVEFSGYSSWSQSRGATVYTLPGGDERTFTWSSFNGDPSSGGVAWLRVDSETLEYNYFMVEGSGRDRKLIIVTLGGEGYSWEDQQTPSTYESIPGLDSEPYCRGLDGSRSPYQSTVLRVFDYKGVAPGSSVDGSGASSTTIGMAVVSALAVAAMALF